MWEKTIHAGFLDRWIKDKFGFPVFVLDRRVVFHGYAAERLAVCGHTITKDAIVRGICNHQESGRNEERYQGDWRERRLGFTAALAAFGSGHGLDYTRLLAGRRA